MKTKMVSILTGMATIAMVLAGSSARAQQHSIGIHFNDSGPGAHNDNANPPMDPSEVAGVPGVAQANWNQVTGPFGYNLGPLNDNNGVAVTGTALSFQGSNTWTSDIPDAPGDSRLMGAYLDSGPVAFNLILVTGLSALTTGSYDVYLYVNGGAVPRHGFYILSNSGIGEGGLIPANSVMKECTVFSFFDPAVGYVEDVQDGNGGNYLHFTALTGNVLLLQVTAQNPNDPTDNGFRAVLNGIQIVAN